MHACYSRSLERFLRNVTHAKYTHEERQRTFCGCCNGENMHDDDDDDDDGGSE